MSGDTLWRLGVAPVLIGMNAFFVAVEFALTRLSSLKLTEEDLEGSPGLRKAKSMLDRLEIHLTGCQLGISTTSVLLGVLAEPGVTRLIEPVVALFGIEGTSVRGISVVVAVVILNIVHKIWGEQAPTYLGVERPRAIAATLAPILSWWTTVMGPVIRLGDGAAKWTLRLFGVEVTRSWASEGELEDRGESGDREESWDREESGDRAIGDRAALKRRMADLLTRGQVPSDRRDEVLASLEIDEIPSSRVMVPIEAMVPLALDVSGEENRARIGRTGHTRYPVLTRDDRDLDGLRLEDVAGVIYIAGLFDPPARILGDPLEMEDLLEPPVICRADLPVADLIDELQRSRQEMALLTRGDRVVGAVTITDAMEAIAGDLQDPLDGA